MSFGNVDLRKLRHASVLSRTRSFVRAAEELHITQSALTRSIQTLEAQFGVRLFDRDRSGVMITPVGLEFLARAETMLIEAQDLAQFMQRTARGETGKVSFGLSALPAKLFLKDVVLDQLIEMQEIHCSVAVRDPDELLELLETDKIEFFLGSHVPLTREATLKVTELAQIRTTLMVRSDHPLQKRQGLSDQDIQAFPVLFSLFEPGSRGEPSIIQGHPRTFASDDYSALMQIALHSDAIWVTSVLPGMEHSLHPRLVPLNVDGTFPQASMTLKSVQLARRTLSPLAQKVLGDFVSRCRPDEY